MSFADLITRMNNTISDRISNVDAEIDGDVVPGYFSNAYADQLGMAGSQPTLSVLSELIHAVAVGQAVTVNATSYTVVGIEPDGTGISTLQLRRA